MYRATGSGMTRVSTFGTELRDLGWPTLDRTDTEQRDWIHRMWSVETFAAAVRVSSPDLARGVERLLDDPRPDPDRTRRICLSLTKYLMRAQTRATPFGLFAGVAALRIGAPAATNVGSAHRVHRYLGPSGPGGPAHAGGPHTNGAPNRRLADDRTLVQVNDLAVIRADRLVLPGGSVSSRAPDEVSITIKPPLAVVLRQAREPIGLGALAAAVRDDLGLADRPNGDARVTMLLHRLVDSMFLVTDSGVPSVSGWSGGTSSDEPDRRHTGVEVDRGSSRDGPHLTVDVRADAAVSIPRQVADEAAAAAAALVRLAPRGVAGRGHWADYHRRFLDRFGLGALVPVTELLHGGDGLGYPGGYHGSALPHSPRHSVAAGLTDSDSPDGSAVLVERALAAIGRRHRELVLTTADLDRIASETSICPQPSTDLRVEVHAASTADLDGGRFRIVVVGASRAAGTVTGRFLDLLDPDDRDRLVQDYRTLPTATTGAHRVELCAVAASPQQATICRAAAVFDDRIVVGDAMPGTLPVSRIAVSADTTGLYLVSLPDRTPVEATLFSALELSAHAHPILRFLAEISTASCAPCVPFSWPAVIDRAPYLPRVRVGRSVLTPARWRYDGHEDLRSWRRRWQLPRRVVLCEHDRRLGVDLDESSHQEVLRRAVARRGSVVLAEAPRADAFGWIVDRPHELVVTVAATHQPRHPTRPRPTCARTNPRALAVPGTGRWLSIELPCRPALQDDVLLHHLPDALNGSWRWWFLRHNDPVPHLRVRIRLTRPEDRPDLAVHLGRWADTLVTAGVLGGPRVQTYRPETGRFGDGDALYAAEEVFVRDSDAVRAQLATHAHSDNGNQSGRGGLGWAGGDHDGLIAASMLNLAEALLPGAGGRWLIENGPRSGPALDPAERAHTIALSEPAGRGLPALVGGKEVRAAWARRAASLVDYRRALAKRDIRAEVVIADLLHLHHSRAVGPNLDAERRCLRLARAAALSHRARHGHARPSSAHTSSNHGAVR